MNRIKAIGPGSLSLILGLAGWLLSVLFFLPFSLYARHQVYVLLLAAPLLLLPLSLQLGGYSGRRMWVLLAAAACFALAYHFPPGVIGFVLVLPWWVMSVSEAFTLWRGWDHYSLRGLVRLAAYIFWVVAASWALVDRIGLEVLAYDPLIILLTVVHFHYAGFLLLQLWLLASPFWPAKISRGIAFALLAGMVLVAIGISTSQIGWPSIIESLAVTVMVIGGMGISAGYIHLGWRHRALGAGWLWMLAGCSLAAGMVLAFLYGWRFHHDLGWLSIPWMYAVHGTLNSMGFALPALLGWAWFRAAEKMKTADK